ncbi:MAG TPA: alpha/beta fold hydrolase [Burkholderiaceae bacterium]|jgi:alpha-beta hydrolase superfamily lysophospholipase|nr:alpha/beta fold hydrolase [Burkholderiaceae bacterium]
MGSLRWVIDGALRWVALAAAAWIVAALAGCAWIDTQQRAKVYKPQPGTMADWKPVSAHDEAFWIDLPHAAAAPDAGSAAAPADAAPGRLRAIWIPADAPGAPAVLYLHGTFRNLYFNRPKIAAIHDAGFSVLAIDYRGWGESTKLLPSEATIMQDAEAAWAEFARRVPEPQRRVLFGHSMGSGVAIELALRHRDPPGYGALVVESALTSMPDLARDSSLLGFLVVPLVTQQFDSIDKIGRIDAPKWFLAGTADKTVPPQQTQQLYDAAHEPKQLVWFDGGSHSGLHTEFAQRYRDVWRDVAAWLGGQATAQR